MACEERELGWTPRSGARCAIRGLLLIGALAIGAVGAARAESAGDGGAEVPAADPADTLDVPGYGAPRTPSHSGDPGLDDLLRLPSDFEARPAEKPVAGASEDEWRRRFVRAEKAIGDAREALVETKKELDGLAEAGGSSQWSVAPPGAAGGGGGQQTTSPLSFKLRQQLNRQRADLDQAERALRELRIEADLAGVPAEWRVVATNPAPAPSAQN
ncbi:hypothetical protein K2X89_05700 [Myxococcota bacterium]|nr:hypothetical protein [Myxococcota bacterium]